MCFELIIDFRQISCNKGKQLLLFPCSVFTEIKFNFTI